MFFIVFTPNYRCFVVVTIDKAAKNFVFICKIYYISRLLEEVGLSNSKSKTHSKATHSIEELVQASISYCKKLDLNITELDKSLPIMHWLPKIHKTPSGARFILVSYYCSTNPLSDIISKIFKMVFNTPESFHNKSFFYSCCKIFWAVQNYFPIGTKLNKINVKKKAKSISTFDFSALIRPSYIKSP